MPETKERVTAGFFPRLCAYLLDQLIVGILLVFVRLPMFFSLLSGNEIFSRAVLFHYTLRSVLCELVRVAYFVILTAQRGATLGKRAMGLRVVNADGSSVSRRTAFFRETVGRYLSGLLNIGYLFMLRDEQHRALHDRIYDTLVVMDPEEKKKDPPAAETRVIVSAGSEGQWYRAD